MIEQLVPSCIIFAKKLCVINVEAKYRELFTAQALCGLF